MDVRSCCILATLVVACAADTWRWPGRAERATSVRIDTKVKFIDDYQRSQNEVTNDPAPFQEALETAGFYNRPANQGRYPVRVDTQSGSPNKQNSPLFDNPLHKHLTIQNDDYRSESDGTLDSIQSCKCSSNPHCLHVGPEKICGEGKYLCCLKKPNSNQQTKTEFFNEEEDERPELLQAGGPRHTGPFPPPPHFEGAANDQSTRVIPRDPHASNSAQRPILVGPGGPTGIIGPRGYNPRYQQPVLVGPGGPTGLIGPGRPRGRGVLVGPGGPTGIIGPRYGRRYEQQPGLLVGPGGPTGVIGPGRHILVGPDGPTGIIGPDDRFDFD